MDNQLIILITGTRKGIGKHLTEHYLSQGHIVIGCSRRPVDLEHSKYSHHQVDLKEEKEIVRMVRSIKKAHGHIDVLINNAGMASMNHLLLSPYSAMKSIFETNYYGSFITSREVAKVMIKKKAGRIINFSTVAVPLNLDGEALYASSKAAVESLTRISAKELGEFGITVNCVGPTPIETDLIKNVPKDKIDELIGHQSLKRFGTFDDVTNVIDFFIKPESQFITGQTIYLGGVM